MTTRLRIAFAGTPDFSVPALDALADADLCQDFRQIRNAVDRPPVRLGNDVAKTPGPPVETPDTRPFGCRIGKDVSDHQPLGA